MRRFLLLSLAGAGFAALVASGPASASGPCPPPRNVFRPRPPFALSGAR